jgi:methylenetetrahydrofolate reductase (NADPH)
VKSGSNLERAILEDQFVVTAEIGPPVGADIEFIRRKMELLRGNVHAANITDCQTAVVRMSSMAASILLHQCGVEPVMQMTCRDRNRIAIQADILGAVAMGVRNCLCISGDHPRLGQSRRFKGHPMAKNVYDLDSIQLCDMLRTMRDEGELSGGDQIDGPLPLLVGAAWTPLSEPLEWRAVRLAKKIQAGADFIQTQGVYDVDGFAGAMARAREQGLHEKTAILPGVIVPRSRAMLRYMDNYVAGVYVPEGLIERFPVIRKEMGQAEKARLREESERIGRGVAIELIDRLRDIEGVRGVHIYAIEWEEVVGEIVREAGICPGGRDTRDRIS